MTAPITHLVNEIKGIASYQRDVKTRQNALRKQYPTTEERREYVAVHMDRQVMQLDVYLGVMWEDYGYDALEDRFAGSPPIFTTLAEGLDFFKLCLLARLAYIHIIITQAAERDAESMGTNRDEAAFETWLLWRFYGPMFVSASLIIDPDIPDVLREKLIALTCGSIEADTNVNFNPELWEVLHSENPHRLYDQLRAELPDAALIAVSEWDSPSLIKRTLGVIIGRGDSLRERQKTDWPVNPDSGELVDAIEDTDNPDPLELLQAKYDAAANTSQVQDFLSTLKGHQRAFAELMYKEPDMLNASAAQIADRLGLKAQDIPNLRQRLKLKARERGFSIPSKHKK